MARSLPWRSDSFPGFYPRQQIEADWNDYVQTSEQLELPPVELVTFLRDDRAVRVLNREFFWQSISPVGGLPSGRLYNEIVKRFGSFEAFMLAFADAVDDWTWLVYSVLNDRLEITSGDKDYSPIYNGDIALLALDRRLDVDTFWHYVDWTRAEALFTEQVLPDQIRVALPGWTS